MKHFTLSSFFSKRVIAFLLSFIFIIFLGDHLFDLWSKSILTILITIISSIGLITILLHWFGWYKQFIFLLLEWKSHYIVLVASLILGIAFTIVFSTNPTIYHNIEIVTDLSNSESVKVIELKVDGNVIPIPDIDDELHWQVKDGGLIATSESSPISITAYAPVDSDIQLLIENISGSGTVSLVNGLMNKVVVFESDEIGQKLIKQRIDYRGLPGWLFTQLKNIIDFISFSLFFYFLICIYKIGECEIENSLFSSQGKNVHIRDLGVLALVSILFHSLFMLSSPLIVDSDGPSYLDLSLYWIKYGTLNGLKTIRVPGTAIFFIPTLLIFGRNPWGIKILLSLFSVGSVLLSYIIGWKLSKNSKLAFLTGFASILIPDMYFSANNVMPDQINIFFVLFLFLLLLLALEKKSFKWYFAEFLVGTYLVLLRPENLIVFLSIICATFLPELLNLFKTKWKNISKNSIKQIRNIFLAALIAFIPIFGWSTYNYYEQGFFGLSNSIGQVLYDGWVYFGEASGMEYKNNDSKAMISINEALSKYPTIISDRSGVETGGEILFSLNKAGYEINESMDLLKNAALDSIKSNWHQNFQLFWLKTKQALRPEIPTKLTYSLPGEPTINRPLEPIYFDSESAPFPALVVFTRGILDWLEIGYRLIYPKLLFVIIASMILTLFRKPSIHWLIAVFISAMAILIPLVISHGNWHYTMYSLNMLIIIFANNMFLIIKGIKKMHISHCESFLMSRKG